MDSDCCSVNFGCFKPQILLLIFSFCIPRRVENKLQSEEIARRQEEDFNELIPEDGELI